jgi:cell division protein FtsB
MANDKGFFRDAGPVILRLEKQAAWSRLDPGQFRRLALLVSALAVGLLIVTWGRVHVLTNGYEIMELQAQRDRLQAEHLRLERRIDDLQSLSHAENVARAQLGMVDINPNQVITLHQKSAARHLADRVEALFERKPAPPAQGKH